MLLGSPMSKKLDGFKELTTNKELLIYKSPDEVAIALTHGGRDVKALVNVGDEVKIGDLIATREDFVYVPFFSPVSGTVKAIEKRASTNLKPVDHIVISNNKKEEVAELKTLDPFNATKEEIIEFIKEKGIVGCGGAGFPAYFKYNTDKCATLIINAVECEPYITADAYMIKHHSDELLYGIKILLKVLNPKKCLIAVKENKKEVIEVLNYTFNDQDKIEIKLLKDRYPFGWERSLVRECLHKTYTRLPIEAGAVIANATTIIKVAEAFKTGMPIIDKVITVSGDGVKNPHNVLCKVGTSFKELIDLCGGYALDEVTVIAGGPMMGNSLIKDDVTVTTSSNAITVLKPKENKECACLRCGRCIEHCPSGLQPVNIVNAFKSSNLELLQKLNINECVECGLCSFVCPSGIEVRENIRRAKKILALKTKK